MTEEGEATQFSDQGGPPSTISIATLRIQSKGVFATKK
jgi:hypothetical protein